MHASILFFHYAYPDQTTELRLKLFVFRSIDVLLGMERIVFVLR